MLKTLGVSHAAFSVFKVTAQHVSEKQFLIMALAFTEKQQGKEG